MFRAKFIHSGSLLLNLALTGDPSGGLPIGGVVNYVGDSSTGKTLLAITAAAFIQNLPPRGYSGFQIAFDTAEEGLNKEFASKVGLDISNIALKSSATVEDFINNLSNFLENIPPGQGGFYVLDSMDALSSEAELDRDPKESATYGTERAKKVSEMFRRCIHFLHEKATTLLIISQVRENISKLPYAPKFRRSGGKALDFYSDQIVWLAEVGKIKASNGLIIGIVSQAKITKNRFGPPFREVRIPILFDYGVDDIRGLLDFLLEKKAITMAGGWVEAEALGVEQKLRLNKLIELIEQDAELFNKTVALVTETWKKLEGEVSQAGRPRLWDLVKKRLSVQEQKEG